MLPTHLKFPVSYNVDLLQKELKSCFEQEWPKHFNTRDFDGDWRSISLRSASGSSNDIYAHSNNSEYQDTDLLAKTPYIKGILDSWKCDKESIRLLALTPGSIIKPHKDLGCAYKDGSFRIHIPVMTNPGVLFTINDDQLNLKEGECWYMDFSQTHSIVNLGETNRVHLIIDGIRNEWTDRFFEQHGYPISEESIGQVYDDETKAKIIEALELMNTDASRALIATMKETN